MGRKVTWLLLHFIPRAMGGEDTRDLMLGGLARAFTLGRLSLEKGALSFYLQNQVDWAAVPVSRLQFEAKKNFPVHRAPSLGGHTGWYEQGPKPRPRAPTCSWTLSLSPQKCPHRVAVRALRERP